MFCTPPACTRALGIRRTRYLPPPHRHSKDRALSWSAVGSSLSGSLVEPADDARPPANRAARAPPRSEVGTASGAPQAPERRGSGRLTYLAGHQLPNLVPEIVQSPDKTPLLHVCAGQGQTVVDKQACSLSSSKRPVSTSELELEPEFGCCRIHNLLRDDAVVLGFSAERYFF